eukprot:3016294-Prymnesium_polylepis.1
MAARAAAAGSGWRRTRETRASSSVTALARVRAQAARCCAAVVYHSDGVRDERRGRERHTATRSSRDVPRAAAGSCHAQQQRQQRLACARSSIGSPEASQSVGRPWVACAWTLYSFHVRVELSR